jgi:hypothetical protein
VRTGVVSNDFNGVVSDAGAVLRPELVEDLIGWFGSTASPASWMVARAEAGLTAVLLAAGARPERTGSWSIRATAVADKTPGADVSVVPVDTDRDLEPWLDVADRCG